MAKQKYEVEIRFKPQQTDYAIGARQMPYYQSGNNKDDISFKKWGVQIVAERNKAYADGTILTSPTNSIPNQIIKVLLFCQAVSLKNLKIKSLNITAIRPRLGNYVYSDTDTIVQPIDSKINKNLVFAANDIEEILTETDKARSLRIALSHWLKGSVSNDRYYKFERYWRAFNRLFSFHDPNSRQERGKIESMKTLIMNNEHLFVKTKAVTNALTPQEISSLRWHLYFKSASSNLNRPIRINELVHYYSDSRIMNLFSNVVADAKINQSLTNAGYINGINSHLLANVATTNDIDLPILIGILYAYYLRNNMFHASVMDATFKIHENNWDKEFDLVNKILESLVYDLIKNHGLL